jgi:transposase
MIFLGDDWAEDHHDVYVMDDAGARVAARHLPEGLTGISGLHELLAGYVDQPGEVVIGIETDRGLWVDALVATGYQVYAINPLAVSRYRDRHQVSGAKSDAGDAKVLADLVRTDRHNHRPIAADSPAAEAIKVLARGHQNLIWTRTWHTNALRSALREYYPAALAAFDDLSDRDALAVLGRAPTPAEGARLTITAICTALKRASLRRDRFPGRVETAQVHIQLAIRKAIGVVVRPSQRQPGLAHTAATGDHDETAHGQQVEQC